LCSRAYQVGRVGVVAHEQYLYLLGPSVVLAGHITDLRDGLAAVGWREIGVDNLGAVAAVVQIVETEPSTPLSVSMSTMRFRSAALRSVMRDRSHRSAKPPTSVLGPAGPFPVAENCQGCLYGSPERLIEFGSPDPGDYLSVSTRILSVSTK
jgi:hypothetical protein